jgi:hypothetical protein
MEELEDRVASLVIQAPEVLEALEEAILQHPEDRREELKEEPVKISRDLVDHLLPFHLSLLC